MAENIENILKIIIKHLEINQNWLNAIKKHEITQT